MRLATLFLFVLICFSCNKTDDIYGPVDIDVKFNDDVSPLTGELSIPGEYDFFEWTFEKITPITDCYANPTYVVFDKEGPAKVKVIAVNYRTGKKVIGNAEIDIPGIAKKLKISGFFFKDPGAAGQYNQKQINVSLHYLKYGVSTVKTFSIPLNTVAAEDTIFFPEPVTFDIDGFITGTFQENDIFVTINAAVDNSLLFRSSFNLTGVYLWEHSIKPDFVDLSNMTPGNSYFMYLLCDWMPE